MRNKEYKELKKLVGEIRKEMKRITGITDIEENKCCLNCRWSHARDDADLEFCIHPKSPNYGEFIYDIKENNPCKHWEHILSEFNWPEKHKTKGHRNETSS